MDDEIMQDLMDEWAEDGRPATQREPECHSPNCAGGDLTLCANCPGVFCDDHLKDLDGLKLCFTCYAEALAWEKAQREHEDEPDPTVEWMEQRMFEAGCALRVR